MLKIKAEFEVNLDGKIGRFIVDQDTSLNIAKEMVFRFQKLLGQIEDQAHQAKIEEEKQKLAQETPKEDPCQTQN